MDKYVPITVCENNASFRLEKRSFQDAIQSVNKMICALEKQRKDFNRALSVEKSYVLPDDPSTEPLRVHKLRSETDLPITLCMFIVRQATKRG